MRKGEWVDSSTPPLFLIYFLNVDGGFSAQQGTLWEIANTITSFKYILFVRYGFIVSWPRIRK